MKFITLPAKTSKDEPNVVEITNRKRDEKLENGYKFQIPADRFEYPQVESLEEAKQIAGSEDRLLEVINDHLRDDSVAEAKNSIRMATTGTDDDIINAGISKGKNYTWVETAKMSAAEAKEAVSNLRAIASERKMTDEELAAEVRKLFNL